MKKILIIVIVTAGFFYTGFSQSKGLYQSNGEPPSTVVSAQAGMINEAKPSTMEEKLKASGVTEGQINEIMYIQNKFDEKLAKLNKEKMTDEEKEKSFAAISEEKENSLKKIFDQEGYRKYLEIATGKIVSAKSNVAPAAKTKAGASGGKVKTKTTATKKG